MATFRALGNSAASPARDLEMFPAPAGVRIVTLDYDEMESLCPVAPFHPDLSRVVITYAPNGRCLESKSVKLYFQTFRDERIFCEDMAAWICTDVLEATAARWVRVAVRQKRRGGIEITSIARLP